MSPITDISQLDTDKTYSYADYLTWRFEQTVELIKGKIWKMSPAPRTNHQRISWNLSIQIGKFLQKNNCEAFAAPFDVRLYDRKKSAKADKEIFTVVQPDLCIICDKEKIDEKGCNGAPELIVEILSKGNSKKEMRIKYDLYQEAGVEEYWIVSPVHLTVHLFVLDKNKKYRLEKIYVSDDTLQSVLLPNLEIDLQKIFPEEEI